MLRPALTAVCSGRAAITAAARSGGAVRAPCRRTLATAALCTEIGKPLVFDPNWSLPEQPPKGHVKVRIAAAGVNYAEILQARGEYQDKAEVPYVPGNEASGEIVSVGEGVSGMAVGDRVICLKRGGAYASETIANAQHCLVLPPAAASADLAEAAALMVNYGTAHLALAHRARLAPGETVLVTAAAGGVGLATVELAQLLGASRVIAACGSDDKLALAASKGAAAPGINYRGMDGKAFRAAVKEAAGSVDVVVDMVGGELLDPAIRSLAWNGRAVVVGFAGGAIPKIPANLLLVKNVSVSGLFWGNHLIHDPAMLLQSAQELVKWWLAGELKPHIGARVPLERANDAFALIESRASTGKVVLVP